jgi:Reverse transcriptase (RNA-dependent DNA polymerase)
LRYADDTVIIADSLEDLQHLVELISIFCKRYGLEMNLKKTKVIATSKNQNTNHNRPSININNDNLEWVSSYKYLGTLVTETAEHTKEIKCRIEVARNAFIKMNKILSSRDITLELRTRMLKCYILSILLYAMEAWTLKSENMKNIEAF